MTSTTTSRAAATWVEPDSPSRYGTVSRLFHWTMALGFLLIFTTALTHLLAEDSALDELLWPLHKTLGVVLMALVVLRGLWALLNAGRRPPHLNAAARLGHLALYALMFAIPAIGLLRQYGSGRAFEPFGLPLIDARPGDEIEWMRSLGGLLHGELGWVLLALAVGHITMAFWHRRRAHENVLPRMLG